MSTDQRYLEPVAHPIRKWARSLPAELSSAWADLRLVIDDISDMWPLVWRDNARRREEWAGSDGFNMGRSWGGYSAEETRSEAPGEQQ